MRPFVDARHSAPSRGGFAAHLFWRKMSVDLLTEYGYNGPDSFPGGDIPGRILAVHRDQYELICLEGICRAILRRSVNFESVPTAGDYVRFTFNPIGNGVINALLPRKSVFIRTDSFSGKPQPVAANFDYLMITTSLNAELNIRRLERYLSQAGESGAQVVIVLTKLDLCAAPEALIAEVRAAADDIPVVPVSAVTGEGMEELKKYAAPGKTIALIGSSGVGKSTIVNALNGCELMRTGAIREDDAHGRHTTTHRQLLMLESGVMVIDTPGMRNLALWDSPGGVDAAFEDISAMEGQCKFNDCTHTHEPGCALIAAVRAGVIAQERLDSYIKLRGEARASAARRGRAARKAAKEKVNKRLR